MPENLYFEVAEPEVISDIDVLLSLNARKMYYRPGDQTPIGDILNLYSAPHATAGIFRGQLCNLPLIPKAFRGIELEDLEASEIVRSYRFARAMYQFTSFCERAEAQNPAFPANIADRMCIAQHFGVPTPLLDWSQNILAAVFFAIRSIYAEPNFEKSLQVFIYHITDERVLHRGIPDADLASFGQSAFIKPFPIDRRIERQQGAFTFHPHPLHRPPKIHVRAYVLEWPMIHKLVELMRGFGFTEDYFLPDYAGIAGAVMSETCL
jgi:hypothetical protein